MKKLLSFCAAFVLALAAAAPAAAVNGLTVYTSREAFLAAISNVAVDTFDDLNTDDNPTELIRTVGDFSYKAWPLEDDTLYRAGVGDDGALSDFGNVGEIALTNFTGGASAVGADFFNTDAYGAGLSRVSVAVTAYFFRDNPQPGDSITDTQTFYLDSDNGSQFIGFTWDRTEGILPTILFRDANSDDHETWPTMDNLTIGWANAAPAPEPATWALALIGFDAIGSALRRRPRLALA